MAKAKILKATTRGSAMRGKRFASTPARQGPAGARATWAKYLMTIIVVALIAFTVFYIIQLSRGSFARKEGFADPSKVVLLHSNTCPHCKDFLPVFEEVQRDPQFASVVFEEAETSSEKASQYMGSLSGVPTVLVIGPNGAPVSSLVGKRTIEVFKKELQDALASSPQ